jgi:hypothetical protein
VVRLVIGHGEHREVGLAQYIAQLVGPVNGMDVLTAAAVGIAAHPDQVHVERRHPCGDPAANRAQADDREGAPGQHRAAVAVGVERDVPARAHRRPA